MGIWSNAFALPKKKPLTGAEKEFLIRVCGKIKKKRMSEIAVFTAESTRPAHNLFSQAVVFGAPFLNFIFSKEDIDRLVSILQNPAAMDFFKENL